MKYLYVGSGCSDRDRLYKCTYVYVVLKVDVGICLIFFLFNPPLFLVLFLFWNLLMVYVG